MNDLFRSEDPALRLQDRELGAIIEGFPNYEVTNRGQVFNLLTGREMVLSPTQHGDLTVGLTRDGRQHRMSVKCLVARAFVPGESPIFNTPILLDGDKYNLWANNIMWRPRWFACRWSRQFLVHHKWYDFGPIVDLQTHKEYVSFIEASIETGSLCRDILESVYNGNHVFPIYKVFAYANQ